MLPIGDDDLSWRNSSDSHVWLDRSERPVFHCRADWG